MTNHRAPISRRRRLLLESLEARDVPATFGIPWADPGHLTISFAPDGTQIAGHTSTLFRTLDPQMPTASWQLAILHGFQEWAADAGINVSVVPDDGSPFGVPGRTSQHDPRFGDIRIGAQAMSSDSLAISVPNDPSMTGTWNGDMLINSSDLFDASHLDLFSVALHEAGHVYGLADSTDPELAALPHLSGPHHAHVGRHQGHPSPSTAPARPTSTRAPRTTSTSPRRPSSSPPAATTAPPRWWPSATSATRTTWTSTR